MTGSPLAITLSSGWPTAAAATPTAPGGRASRRRRRRVEGILWMTREGVGEGDGGDPVLGFEGKRSLSSQSPDAEELSHRVEYHLLLLVHPRTQG